MLDYNFKLDNSNGQFWCKLTKICEPIIIQYTSLVCFWLLIHYINYKNRNMAQRQKFELNFRLDPSNKYLCQTIWLIKYLLINLLPFFFSLLYHTNLIYLSRLMAFRNLALDLGLLCLLLTVTRVKSAVLNVVTMDDAKANNNNVNQT